MLGPPSVPLDARVTTPNGALAFVVPVFRSTRRAVLHQFTLLAAAPSAAALPFTLFMLFSPWYHTKPLTVVSTNGILLGEWLPFHTSRYSRPPAESGQAVAPAYDPLFMNSSMRCPPVAVSAIPIGVATPPRACAKYQQAAPMSKRLYVGLVSLPSAMACCDVFRRQPRVWWLTG